MQTKNPHKYLKSASNHIDKKEYSQEARKRYEILAKYNLLKGRFNKKEIVKVLEVPLSTIYRWKKAYKEYGFSGLENESKSPLNKRKKEYSDKLIKLVLKIRKANPIWGKKKITIILKRDYNITASISTVGRIISELIRSGRVEPACFYYGRLKVKKKRIFNDHAKRWKYGMKSTSHGELVQIDHATIEVEPDKYIKQFDATCPTKKYTVSQAYKRATSNVAANFLEHIIDKFPFSVKSIQVDGGS